MYPAFDTAFAMDAGVASISTLTKRVVRSTLILATGSIDLMEISLSVFVESDLGACHAGKVNFFFTANWPKNPQDFIGV